MFVDALALILIMVPIFYPIAMAMGFSGVHFGIIICLVMATGALTPPFGMVVYAIGGIAKDVPLFNIFRGVAPFLIAIMLCEVLVVFLPQISLFLPSLMLGGV